MSIERRLRAGFMALAAVLSGVSLLYAPPAPGACTPQLPCGDSRGCPDLRVDPRGLDSAGFEIRLFEPDSCPVVEGMITSGERRLMRFDTILPNLGPGDLKVGDPAAHPGLFERGECHGHLHLRGYADYRLWTPSGYARWRDLRAANPDVCTDDLLGSHASLQNEMVAGHKQGFCVIDIEDVCRTGVPWHYGDCDLNQGISTGWSDIYDAGLEGQWIDITGLPSGNYVFEVEVNPLRLVVETNYINNAAAKVVTVP